MLHTCARRLITIPRRALTTGSSERELKDLVEYVEYRVEVHNACARMYRILNVHKAVFGGLVAGTYMATGDVAVLGCLAIACDVFFLAFHWSTTSDLAAELVSSIHPEIRSKYVRMPPAPMIRAAYDYDPVLARWLLLHYVEERARDATVAHVPPEEWIRVRGAVLKHGRVGKEEE
jgi:hypothetical protein